MQIQCGDNLMRAYRDSDLDVLIELANDPEVARNLRDGFPSPYTRADGERWVAHVMATEHDTVFAIERGGAFCGTLGGYRKTQDACFTAEVGYWLGRRYWSQGIVSSILPRFVEHLFATTDLVRLEARVLPWNPASSRVLEKSGFNFEGRLRRAQLKNGEVHDTLLYSRVRGE